MLRREVALKEALGNPDGPEAKRLRREARITAALDHPGIVPVYDLGENGEGRPYFVMRLVRGRSLGDALEACSRYEDRAHLVRNFLAVCEAVAFAHDAGVVHRDIKPDNILVGPYGETQVMDWGLARTLDDDDWDGVLTRDFRTREGAILGTPAYMSPEQATGEEVGPGVDVWALGAVLYEILAGQRAVKGPSQREMIAQILSGSRLSLSSIVPEADAELIAIAERALHRDPAKRYANAGAMAQALEAWFEGRRAALLAQDRSEQQQETSHRWPLLTVAAATVVAAAIGWWARGAGPPPPQELAAVSSDDEVVRDALVTQARQASSRGERALAEQFAAQALSRGEHAGARGVLAAHGLDPTPRLLHSADVPPCVESALHAESGLYVCAAQGTLTAFGLDGATRWALPIQGERLLIEPAGKRLIGYNRDTNAFMVLDTANGGPVILDKVRLNITNLRKGLSLVPNRFITLMNGPSQEFWAQTAASNTPNEKHSPCGDLQLDWVLETPEAGVYNVVCEDRSLVRFEASTKSSTPLLPALSRDSIAWTGAVDATGRWLVLGGVEGDVELIDRQTMERVHSFGLTQRMVREVSVAPGGAVFAALDAAGVVWVIPAADPDGRYQLPGRAQSIGFDPSGTLSVARVGRLERWTTPMPSVKTSVPLESGLLDLAWSEHGIAVAVGGAVRLDSQGRTQLAPGAEELIEDPDSDMRPEVRSVAWTVDGDMLAAGHNVGVHRLIARPPRRWSACCPRGRPSRSCKAGTG